MKKGSHHTPEAKRKIAAANTRERYTKERAAKISLTHTGKKLTAEHIKATSDGIKLWWKNRTKEDIDKFKNNLSIAIKGRRPSQKTINASILAKTGTKHTIETRKKMSSARLGYKPLKESILKGIATRKKLTDDRGYYFTEETKRRIGMKNSINMKNKFKNKEFAEKHIKALIKAACQRPNKFETACGIFLNALLPNEFKYVGDGSVLINYKSPDFISNKRKLIVLCNGIYWHLLRYGFKDTDINKENIEMKESSPFLRDGYDVMFIWENVKTTIGSMKIIFKEVFTNSGYKFNQRYDLKDIDWFNSEDQSIADETPISI